MSKAVRAESFLLPCADGDGAARGVRQGKDRGRRDESPHSA
jgi:hypothetical protein